LSGLLREALEELLPVDLAAWVDVASLLRPALAARGLPLAKRREAVLSVLVERYARQGRGAA
jgi:hypothetical protein